MSEAAENNTMGFLNNTTILSVGDPDPVDLTQLGIRLHKNLLF
jgi:hypothetical protein